MIDEARAIVSRAVSYNQASPTERVAHLDNLPGARVYVRDSHFIARRLGPPPRQVLDWGCGYGQLAWLLANRGYAVTAMDLPGEDYPALGLLEHPRITFQHLADPVRIEAPAASFDAILSSGTLEHVPSIAQSMVEVCRLLRPGGLFFIFRFPNQHSYIEWFARRRERWHHPIRMTPGELRLLMKLHSLEVLAAGYDTLLPVTCKSPLVRRLRPWRERLDAPLTWLDRRLVRVPLLARLSTSLWLVARKCADYAQPSEGITPAHAHPV